MNGKDFCNEWINDERRLTHKQAAILTAYTGIMFGPIRDFHRLAEALLGRPVFTHEFADKKTLDEIKAAAKPLLLAIVPEEILGDFK